MTNAPVKDFNQSFLNVTSTNAQSNSNSNTFNSSFTKVMSNANSSGANSSNANSQQSNKVNDKVEQSMKPKVEKKREDVIKNTKDSNEAVKEINKNSSGTSEVNGDVGNEQVISEKATEVLSEISQQLEVTEEQVMKAMEVLGLGMVNLLNPDNLAGLVVEISGETDMLSLATNEELYQTLQNLTDTVGDILGEIQQELSLTNGQLESLLSKVKEQFEIQQNAENPLISETVADVEGNQHVEEKVIVPEIVIENLTKGNEAQQKEIGDQLSKETVDNEETLQVAGEASKPSESNTKGNENSENGSSLFQGFTNQTANSIINQEIVQTSLEEADVENIIKQITDYMKIQVKADLTEIELQLHPASLGTINLQIASKAGVITAQFTAQNEAVKQALETQIVQLRENLEQQGIKIEAVEVAIASHEFERNLNKGNDSNTDSEQEKKRSTRRINLNELTLEEEQTLDPGDLLTRDIMVKNGNTVDYTA